MRARYWMILIVVALIILTNAAYIVGEREQVIITQFGEPVGEPIKDAGLHFKTPFVRKVHFFEKRLLEWDGERKQIPTSDKRYIWVDTFARWEISDPLKFFETTRSETFAHSRLDDIISGTTRDFISSVPLIEVVRDSKRDLRYTEEYYADLEKITSLDINTGRSALADSILKISKPQLIELGIKLNDVKIKRVNYIEDVRRKVYERMISERNKIAAKYRSAGQGEAAEIRGKKQKELDRIESEAYRKSQLIKGKADAEATKIYANAFNKDPDFYKFTQTLDSYRKTIDDKNILIISTDSEYFDIIKDGK